MMLNRKNVVITLFTYLSILLIPAVSIQAAQVHAIIVADTIDSMHGMETNIDMMHREAKRIAGSLDMPLHIAIFEHFEVRIENLLSYLQELKIESDDIVIFYINNHGGRLINKSNKWPDLAFILNRLYLTNDDKIDFKELNDILKNKGPKFLLSIADSCNEYVDKHKYDNDDLLDTSDDLEVNSDDFDDDENYISNADEIEFAMQIFLSTLISGPTFEYNLSQNDRSLERVRDRIDDDVIDLYRKLYLETNGNIMISSSSPGELAHIDIFTPLFLKAFTNIWLWSWDNYDEWDNVLLKPPMWNEILLETSKNVHEKFKSLASGLLSLIQETQTIQYELDIH